MIRDVHTGLMFYPSQIHGSKRHRIPDPDPQHCIAVQFRKLIILLRKFPWQFRYWRDIFSDINSLCGFQTGWLSLLRGRALPASRRRSNSSRSSQMRSPASSGEHWVSLNLCVRSVSRGSVFSYVGMVPRWRFSFSICILNIGVWIFCVTTKNKKDINIIVFTEQWGILLKARELFCWTSKNVIWF